MPRCSTWAIDSLHPHGRSDRLHGGVSRSPTLYEAPELTEGDAGPFGDGLSPSVPIC